MVRLACGLLLASVLSFGNAFAHSTKEGTAPEDGAQLDTAPSQVMIQFDEPATLTRVELTHSHDGQAQDTRLTLPGEATEAAHLKAPDFGPGV